MTTKTTSRRSALKLVLAGTLVSVGTACNALKQLPRGQSGGSTDGSELALRVRSALRNHAYTSQLSLNITSDADVVILKGFVNDQNDIQNIEIVANQVEGVRHAQVEVYVRD